MSSDLSQNSKYTIISGNNVVTLFWYDYLDREGIASWFYIQDSQTSLETTEKLYYQAGPSIAYPQTPPAP